MSDTSGPVANPEQNPVTEPLQLADQSPLEPVAESRVEKKDHTRTILEVVGACVAGFLILAAAGVGFAIGHVTSDGDRGFDRGSSMANGQGRGQQGFGMPDQQGQRGQQGQGMDPRGIDPDGDNWTGGGMMGGQQGQGMDPRGIDPDGDNWTGGGQQGLGQPDQQGTAPVTPTP